MWLNLVKKIERNQTKNVKVDIYFGLLEKTMVAIFETHKNKNNASSMQPKICRVNLPETLRGHT